MIGKRGRHKASKKQTKVDYEPEDVPEYQNQDDSIMSSESFSPKKAPRKQRQIKTEDDFEKPNANMTLRS